MTTHREQPKFGVKIEINMERTYRKNYSRKSGIYIWLKISPFVLYRIVMVNIYEYLPQKAPVVNVLLKFGSKLTLFY